MNSLMRQGSQLLSEFQVRCIMEQLLLAVDFIHSKGIIHRDLKLDNILINQVKEDLYDIRIADFGLATFFDKDADLLKFDACGTPGFAAPEVLKFMPYDFKADIFSVGSVLFTLLSGRYLFTGSSFQEVLKNNTLCKLGHIHSMIKQCAKHVSEPGKKLLYSLLSVNPALRPSAKEALNHDWFKCDRDLLSNLLRINDTLAQQDRLRKNRMQRSSQIVVDKEA